jgi:hypothetical protein
MRWSSTGNARISMRSSLTEGTFRISTKNVAAFTDRAAGRTRAARSHAPRRASSSMSRSSSARQWQITGRRNFRKSDAKWTLVSSQRLLA